MKIALAGRSAADVVKSKRLVSFGKTRLSERPQPVLNCMETMVICAARLTTSRNSIQINVIDTPPFVPPSRPKLNTDESAEGQILANVWEAMYRFRKEQMDDFAHGKCFRLGARQIPIGIDGMSLRRHLLTIAGIARAEKEARMLILPFIRESDVGQSWVMCNLHRTWAYERNGEMLEESRYPALEEAKTKFPIPQHAFYQGSDVSVTHSLGSSLTTRLPSTVGTWSRGTRRLSEEGTRTGRLHCPDPMDTALLSQRSVSGRLV